MRKEKTETGGGGKGKEEKGVCPALSLCPHKVIITPSTVISTWCLLSIFHLLKFGMN